MRKRNVLRCSAFVLLSYRCCETSVFDSQRKRNVLGAAHFEVYRTQGNIRYGSCLLNYYFLDKSFQMHFLGELDGFDRIFTQFNPASTDNFFFKFWSNFSVCFSLRPLDMRSERKFFLSIPEICFLDATRFV